MNLTDEQLRVEVCRCLGWACLGGCDHPDYQGWVKRGEAHPDGMRALPPLTLDLMWEAEETLSDDEHMRYVEMLISPGFRMGMMLSLFKDICHIKATQRARAFLKVKGVEM